jgi:hypothetical protein
MVQGVPPPVLPDEPAAVPLLPTLAVPLLPAVAVPLRPAVAVPLLPAVAVPLLPAVALSLAEPEEEPEPPVALAEPTVVALPLEAESLAEPAEVDAPESVPLPESVPDPESVSLSLALVEPPPLQAGKPTPQPTSENAKRARLNIAFLVSATKGGNIVP